MDFETSFGRVRLPPDVKIETARGFFVQCRCVLSFVSLLPKMKCLDPYKPTYKEQRKTQQTTFDEYGDEPCNDGAFVFLRVYPGDELWLGGCETPFCFRAFRCKARLASMVGVSEDPSYARQNSVREQGGTWSCMKCY